MTAEERSVQRLTLAVLESYGRDASASFENVLQASEPCIAIAILMVISRTVAHDLTVNTLQVPPTRSLDLPRGIPATISARQPTRTLESRVTCRP